MSKLKLLIAIALLVQIAVFVTWLVSFKPEEEIALEKLGGNAFRFPPHLLYKDNLEFGYISSKNRSDYNIVIGVTTKWHRKGWPLMRLLHSLMENMNQQEREETLIVVFIGEVNMLIVQRIVDELELRHKQHLESGLIDIIAPDRHYFPDLEQLRLQPTDTYALVKQQSKQNLDLAFLMSYARNKGLFYVQLEDHMLSLQPQFVSTMKRFAYIKSALGNPKLPSWFVLDFNAASIAGKLFKCAELPYFINYLQMFYNDMNSLQLLHFFIQTKVCYHQKMSELRCERNMQRYWLKYDTALFGQSMLTKVSSTTTAAVPQTRVLVSSSMSAYQHYILSSVYLGERYYIGRLPAFEELPQPGDVVQFIFQQPTLLRSYIIRSGSTAEPLKRLYNTNVEVRPALEIGALQLANEYNVTEDEFLIVGAFDSRGVAAGMLDASIGALQELRLRIQDFSDHEVLLNEIKLELIE
ncbi:alpha-1,3-mannosyl-glycoprotein 4-beta-N-acetylglucosaminyltransferase B [Drosophila busckii]|uniref:alpha-1,3-mannosyl-glycoprotein 4-beta-N-acetylglucosaminyltransferase B n=1 Tax=Drosophila busckii TaxID=30019 RepID=UPI00143283D1|nr:alpha-1,3-mannosyl-glycoprotein 4-beta-N-acetylglucosaminyltransferase B [Drosophila busckii]